MQTITPFLTFKEKAEEAINLYVSIFKNSSIEGIFRYEEDGMLPKGSVMHAIFKLNGQEFRAMDGGPMFPFEQGFSVFVYCDTQEEIDTAWNALKEGGEEQMCGWVKDKYGLSWQIIPRALGDIMSGPDQERAGRMVPLMLGMRKLVIKELEEA